MIEETRSNNDIIRVQLNYPKSIVSEPIVYRLVTDFGLVPNIRHAKIDVHTGGYLFLELSGKRANLDRALEWLEAIGVGIDAIGVDGTQEWAIG